MRDYTRRHSIRIFFLKHTGLRSSIADQFLNPSSTFIFPSRPWEDMLHGVCCICEFGTSRNLSCNARLNARLSFSLISLNSLVSRRSILLRNTNISAESKRRKTNWTNSLLMTMLSKNNTFLIFEQCNRNNNFVFLWNHHKTCNLQWQVLYDWLLNWKLWKQVYLRRQCAENIRYVLFLIYVCDKIAHN